MNIQRFAELTGLSAHTLRYYEKIGLLRHVQRGSNGHRHFTPADIQWVEFIKRLKETGMPLEDIQQYANLREQGDSTATERMSLLQQHAQSLEQRIATESAHLLKLQEKIRHYRELIAAAADA
ncbi:MAG TPA: MerR family transcriptional regulator [Pseudomonas sp.]|nr:MerR family transcriptional regulator [Pseudomonas sp.]